MSITNKTIEDWRAKAAIPQGVVTTEDGREFLITGWRPVIEAGDHTVRVQLDVIVLLPEERGRG